MATPVKANKLCWKCRENKPRNEFEHAQGKRCRACSAPKPRECSRCGEMAPASSFVPRGRICEACRKTPPPSEIRPRPCVHCHEVKGPDEFPWGDGRNGRGVYRRRRGVCLACVEREKQEKEKERAARRARLQTWERDGVTVRRCSACEEVHELTEHFYRDGVHRDGSDKYGYLCKPCAIDAATERKHADPDLRKKNAERNRSWRQRNPEKSRALQRRYREKLKKDKARYAAHLEAQRIAHRLRRERLDGVNLADIRSLPAVGSVNKRRLLLTARPLVDVVLDRIGDGDARRFLEMCGIEEKQWYRWRTGESKHVFFDDADGVLVALDLLWFDVWTPADPEGYEIARRVWEGDTEVAAA